MGFLGGDKRPAREPRKLPETKVERARREHQESGTGFSAGNTDDSQRGRGRESGHYNRDDE